MYIGELRVTFPVVLRLYLKYSPSSVQLSNFNQRSYHRLFTMTHVRARFKSPASAYVHQLHSLAIPDKGFFPLALGVLGQVFLRLVRPSLLPTASQQVIYTLMSDLLLPGNRSGLTERLCPVLPVSTSVPFHFLYQSRCNREEEEARCICLSPAGFC